MADKKPQKREFVRLDIMLPVKYRKYTGNPVFSEVFGVGRSLNISSGGMMLSVSTAMKPGTLLDMEMELTEKVRIYLMGRVIGSEEKEIADATHIIEKISFEDVDEDTRDIITRFIFDHQRKNLRRGTAG